MIFNVNLVLRSSEIFLLNKFFHLFPHLELIYFHSHSLATRMTKMSSNIFFRNVLLGNTMEGNVQC